MKIVQQNVALSVENNDYERENKTLKHGVLFPETIRCIIVGPSNCGKTNVLISLIEHENGVKFENIYIYSHSFYGFQ